jgi:hypothetical protein
MANEPLPGSIQEPAIVGELEGGIKVQRDTINEGRCKNGTIEIREVGWQGQEMEERAAPKSRFANFAKGRIGFEIDHSQAARELKAALANEFD